MDSTESLPLSNGGPPTGGIGFDFTIEADNESVTNSTITSVTSDSQMQMDIEEGQDPISRSRNLLNRERHDDYSDDGGPSSFNAVDYLVETLNAALDSIELDRSLVLQSQISGEINNTSKEIIALMDILEEKLNEHVGKYEYSKKVVIPELLANISKSQKVADRLTAQMKQLFPVEYSKSKDKILNRVTDEEDDMYV